MIWANGKHASIHDGWCALARNIKNRTLRVARPIAQCGNGGSRGRLCGSLTYGVRRAGDYMPVVREPRPCESVGVWAWLWWL